ncbi:DUF397 domain-containing protein [Streptomyces sp. NPDC056486]|uniref:DUF397 domain-containing protein n=1 Tax=Streptomyces sp. NPDC056486 TaxID=3345835 RepID=UPI00368818E1
MGTVAWQKSSFSGGTDGAECVELGSAGEVLLLRESDDPARVLHATPEGLAALIRHVQDESAWPATVSPGGADCREVPPFPAHPRRVVGLSCNPRG